MIFRKWEHLINQCNCAMRAVHTGRPARLFCTAKAAMMLNVCKCICLNSNQACEMCGLVGGRWLLTFGVSLCLRSGSHAVEVSLQEKRRTWSLRCAWVGPCRDDTAEHLQIWGELKNGRFPPQNVTTWSPDQHFYRCHFHWLQAAASVRLRSHPRIRSARGKFSPTCWWFLLASSRF